MTVARECCQEGGIVSIKLVRVAGVCGNAAGGVDVGGVGNGLASNFARGVGKDVAARDWVVLVGPGVDGNVDVRCGIGAAACPSSDVVDLRAIGRIPAVMRGEWGLELGQKGEQIIYNLEHIARWRGRAPRRPLRSLVKALIQCTAHYIRVKGDGSGHATGGSRAPGKGDEERAIRDGIAQCRTVGTCGVGA